MRQPDEQGPKSAVLPAPGHGEMILVVDDEAAIAQITRHTLEANGYQVVTAADGAEAVVLFQQHRAEYPAMSESASGRGGDWQAVEHQIRQLLSQQRQATFRKQREQVLFDLEAAADIS